jgi:Periplasmic protein involved in polysaccharide export
MNNRLYFLLVICFIVISSVSCSTVNKISYLQDVEESSVINVANPNEIRIKKDDKISIIVNSKDAELANLFNLPIISNQVGGIQYQGLGRGLSGYTVDSNGEIDFPILGKLKIEGMKREQVAAYIKNKLISSNYVKDPVVTVEYMNLTISVLGEVNRPGKYNIEKDKITVFDALSMAGDLTIYGKRDNVYVMRNIDGQQHIHKLDLRNSIDIYTSEVYYLQQDDVVYVEPNKVRARQSTVNGNNVRSASFWISITSLLATLSTFFINKYGN